jgi:hypothetical protein
LAGEACQGQTFKLITKKKSFVNTAPELSLAKLILVLFHPLNHQLLIGNLWVEKGLMSFTINDKVRFQ